MAHSILKLEKSLKNMLNYKLFSSFKVMGAIKGIKLNISASRQNIKI